MHFGLSFSTLEVIKTRLMKKTLFVSGPLLLVLVVVAIFIFNGSANLKSKCKHISGVVTSIYQGGTKDAVFKIAGHSSVFYINRGLEKNFSLNALIEKLEGKQVTILYADSRTPLGDISDCRSISELSTDQEMVYSEFEGK